MATGDAIQGLFIFGDAVIKQAVTNEDMEDGKKRFVQNFASLKVCYPGEYDDWNVTFTELVRTEYYKFRACRPDTRVGEWLNDEGFQLVVSYEKTTKPLFPDPVEALKRQMVMAAHDNVVRVDFGRKK